MVKRIFQYDHPNYIVHREMGGQEVAAAASSFAHFSFYQKSRVRGVHCTVLTAGTSTATPADAALRVDVLGTQGTTSIGNLYYGTNSAMHQLHATVTATVMPMGGIRFSKTLDASGITAPVVEYEVLPDATQL